MNLNTISVEEFHRHLYDNYTKKSVSVDLYFDQCNTIHKIYEFNRLDLLRVISNTYGAHHLSRKNNEGDTILHIAAKTSKINTQQLISFGSDLTIYNNDGYTPFHYICKRYDVSFVRSLESRTCIDANHEDKDGYLPIFIALIEGDYRLFIYLIDHTANIDHSDNVGNTLLHYACLLNKSNAVNVLIKHNACKMHKNSNGLTPYDLTTDEYIKLIISGKVSQSNKSGEICIKCDLIARMPYQFKCGHIYCYECLVHYADNQVVNCMFDCKSAIEVKLSDIITNKSFIDYDNAHNVDKYYHYKFNKLLANSLVGHTNIRYLDSLVIVSDNVHLVLIHRKDMFVIKVIYLYSYKSYTNEHRLELLKKILCINKQSLFVLHYGSLYLNKDRLSSTIMIRLEVLNYNKINSILRSIIIVSNWVHSVLSTSRWNAELLTSMCDNDISPIYNTELHIDRFIAAIGTKSGLSFTISVDGPSVVILEDTMGLRIKMHNYAVMQAIVIYTRLISIHIDHLDSYEYLVTYKPANSNLSNFRVHVLPEGDVVVYVYVNYIHNDLSSIRPTYNAFRKECNRLKKLVITNCSYVEE